MDHKQDQMVLRERELLDHLIASSVDGILAFDLECRYTIWNPAMERISGVLAPGVLGKVAFDVFPFLRETGEDEYFSRALKGETVIARDRPYVVPQTGQHGFFEAHYAPLHNAEGEVIGGLAIVRDITERKQAEESLRQSESNYRALVEEASEGIAIFDRNANLLDINSRACQMLGYTRGEVLGRNLREFIPAEDLAAQPLLYEEVLASGEVVSTQRRVRKRDGRLLPVEANSRMLADGRVQVIFRDITERLRAEEEIKRLTEALERRVAERTAQLQAANAELVKEVSERKRAEEELRRSRDQLQIILQGVADGITVQDRTGRLVFANDAAASAMGFDSAAALLNTPVSSVLQRFELLDEQGKPLPWSRLPGRLVLQGMESQEAVLGWRVVATGEERWSIVKASPVFDEQGQVQLAVNIFRDITERRRAEAQLQTRARQAAAIAYFGQRALAGVELDSLLDEAVYLVAQTLDVEYCKVLELLPSGDALLLRSGVGWREGLVGQATVGAGLDSQAGYTLSSSAPVVVEDLPSETRFTGPSLLHEHGVVSGMSVIIQGKDRPFGVLGAHSTRRRIFTEDDVHFLQAIANLLATAIKRKDAEEELQRRMEQLRRLYQLSDAVSRAGEIEQIYAVAMDGLQNTVGADRASILLFDPDGVMRFKAWRGLSDNYRRATEGHSPWPRDAHNPQPIFIDDVEAEESLGELRDVILGEGIRALGFIPLVYQGQLLGKFMVYRNAPTRFGEDEGRLAQTIASNIAFAIERRRGEEEREQLLASEQQARSQAEQAVHARDELLAIVSHDLKNPLAAIRGNAQLLERRLAEADRPTSERLAALIGRIHTSARKMDKLINELMDFGRLQAGQPLILQHRPTNLVSLARQVAADGQYTTQLHRIHVEEAAPTVIGRWDADRLERVIANLLSNAIKYSPGGGDIHMQVATETADGQQWAVLRVCDQGLGIASEDLPHIFEWFRRAHSTNRQISGAGIGLAGSSYIVRAHGGTITVESELGKGSTFTVRLPLQPPRPDGGTAGVE